MGSGKESENIETEHLSPTDRSPKTHQNSPIYDHISKASDLLMSVSVRANVNKQKITNLVVSAMEEIRQLVTEQEALWVFDMEAGTCSLNVDEYRRRFSPLDPTLDEIVRMIKTQEPILGIPNLKEVEILPGVGSACLDREASRNIGVVCMNPVNLVRMFMDVDQWSRMFSSIVSNAGILEVISDGKGSCSLDGALQVMAAEFHISSPLVQTRESYFARYSKQLSVNIWAVVDVSLDSIFPDPTARFLRRPSGCFIESMGNGYSKVLWIEHLEVDNTLVHHLFKPLVASGLAFGARRWLGTLACECDRLVSYMDDRVPIMQEGRKSILKLAERMMRSYHAGVSASPENSTWKPIPISGAEDILVTTSYNDSDPETPRGVSITVATTIWLPNHPKNVFDFLQNGNHRSQWDVLCLKRCSQEATRVSTSHDPANCVSIIKIDTLPLIFYLQESQSTSTGSYVVYAPVDLFTMNSVLSGNDPDNVQILASGFAVLPDRHRTGGEENGTGTLLTIAIRVMDQHSSTPEYLPPISVLTVYSIITETVGLIRAVMTR